MLVLFLLKHKNDIIARAILEILSSGRQSTQIRDQIFSVLTRYNTSELNLETKVFQPGYVRSLKQCLLIDSSGKMREMELLVSFIEKFLDDSFLPNLKMIYPIKNIKIPISNSVIILPVEIFFSLGIKESSVKKTPIVHTYAPTK